MRQVLFGVEHNGTHLVVGCIMGYDCNTFCRDGHFHRDNGVMSFRTVDSFTVLTPWFGVEKRFGMQSDQHMGGMTTVQKWVKEE